MCKECGRTFLIGGYQGYCKECYGQIWDNGFESTSEHAYEIGHSELNRKLEGPVGDGYDDAIREIVSDFSTDRWVCTRCEEVRLAHDPTLSIIEIIEILRRPCKQCGVSGYVRHTVRGRYFS